MRGEVRRTPFCCGLMEIGGFDDGYRNDLKFLKAGLRVNEYVTHSAGYTYMCVTRRMDLKQKIWLKKNGFKVAGRWKNPNTRRMLTLWLKFPAK